MSPQPFPSSRWGASSRALRFLIPALAAFLLYAPSLSYDMVWDDVPLLDIVSKAGDSGWRGLLTTDYTALEPTGYYRPVTVLSLRLDQLWGGGRPWAFHLTNILLHALSSILVLLLLEALGLPPGPAFLGALLFAVHPAHVESVAFTANRSNLWMGVFVFLSALAWARGREAGPGAGALPPILGGAGMALAMLSKEPAFLLPPVLVAWEVLAAAEGGAWKGRGAPGRWLRGLLPWLAAWGAAGAFALVARGAAGVGWGEPVRAIGHVSPWGTIPGVMSTAVRVTLFPLAPNPMYSPDQLQIGGPGLLALLFFLVLVFFPFDRTGVFRGGRTLLWSLAFLVPTLGFVPIRGAVFREGFLYASLLAFSLTAAVLLSLLRGKGRLAGTALVLGAAGFLAVSTLSWEGIWKEEKVLFTYMVERSPAFSGGFLSLGLVLAREGDLPGARALMEKAVTLDRHPRNLEGLAVALMRTGEPARAEGLLREALLQKPGDRGITGNLAGALVLQGRWERAEEVLRNALAKDPGWSEGRSLLARVLSGPAGKKENLP